MNRRERGAKAKYYARKYGVSLRHKIVKLARTKRWKSFQTALFGVYGA